MLEIINREEKVTRACLQARYPKILPNQFSAYFCAEIELL